MNGVEAALKLRWNFESELKHLLGVCSGSMLSRFRADFRSVRSRLEIDLGSVWDQFGISLGSVRGRCWVDFEIGLSKAVDIWKIRRSFDSSVKVLSIKVAPDMENASKSIETHGIDAINLKMFACNPIANILKISQTHWTCIDYSVFSSPSSWLTLERSMSFKKGSSHSGALLCPQASLSTAFARQIWLFFTMYLQQFLISSANMLVIYKIFASRDATMV